MSHFKSLKVVIFSGVFLTSGLAPAQNRQESLTATMNELKEALKAKDADQVLDSRVHGSGSLTAEGAQYVSPISDKPRLNQSLLVKANVRPQAEVGNTRAVLDFTAERFVDWETSHYSLKEASLSFQWRDRKSEFSVGRKVEFWSQLDKDWNLGLWQPYSLLDSLRPEEQGLTGFFYRHEQGPFEFLALGSPIYIPSMGPDIKEENGSLVADSRWFRSPSPSFILFDQQRRVVYSLNLPDLQKLVNKPGMGLRASFGRNSNGFWASMNYGYKPINSLVLKYDQKLALSESGQDTGSALLYPDATYHNLFGGDVGYRISDEAMLSASYLEDRPANRLPQEPYIVQHANPVKAYSLHGDARWTPVGKTRPLDFKLGYLRMEGGDYTDRDSNGAAQGAVFANRFNFYNAAFVEAQMTSSLFRKKTVSKIRYLREFDQRGMMASAAFDFLPAKSVVLTVGADVLGVDDTSDGNKSPGFLNEFRANDRYYAGVSYVF